MAQLPRQDAARETPGWFGGLHPMGDATSGLCRLSFNPQLRVEFRGATAASDAGLLWPRELDERHLTDPCSGRNRQVPLPDLFRQFISSRLAGYENSNDAERLAAEGQVISCSASRCITARELRRALQVRGHADAGGARPGSFVVLYRITQSHNAAQDTERCVEPWTAPPSPPITPRRRTPSAQTSKLEHE